MIIVTIKCVVSIEMAYPCTSKSFLISMPQTNLFVCYDVIFAFWVVLEGSLARRDAWTLFLGISLEEKRALCNC